MFEHSQFFSTEHLQRQNHSKVTKGFSFMNGLFLHEGNKPDKKTSTFPSPSLRSTCEFYPSGFIKTLFRSGASGQILPFSRAGRKGFLFDPQDRNGSSWTHRNKKNVRTLDHKPRSTSNLGLRPRYEKHLGFMVSVRNYYFNPRP